MKIPNKYPTYFVTIPSTGEKIKIRPYNIAEEKKMLIAIQSDDIEVLSQNIVDTLNACILSDIKVEDLPIGDATYVFMNIKARSQANTVVKLTISQEDCENEECPVDISEEIDITTVPLQVFKDGDWVDVNEETAPKKFKQIEFFKGYGVQIRQPGLLDGSYTNNSDELKAKCLVSVFDGDQVYEDFSYEEALEYVQKLDVVQSDMITNWFDSLPSIRKECKFTCPKCQKVESVPISGLSYFFE